MFFCCLLEGQEGQEEQKEQQRDFKGPKVFKAPKKDRWTTTGLQKKRGGFPRWENPPLFLISGCAVPYSIASGAMRS